MNPISPPRAARLAAARRTTLKPAPTVSADGAPSPVAPPGRAYGPRANRHVAGLSLGTLALRTGYSVDYLRQVESAWERAAALRDTRVAPVPPLRALIKIARALRVDEALMLRLPPAAGSSADPVGTGVGRPNLSGGPQSRRETGT